MKDNIYKFIKEYVSYCDESISYKIGVPELVEFPENCNLRKMLEVLRVNDIDSYNNLLVLDKDEILYEYLKFMLKYYDSKTMIRISTSRIAKLADIPVFAIRQIENLKVIADFKKICAMAKSVNLTLKWE